MIVEEKKTQEPKNKHTAHTTIQKRDPKKMNVKTIPNLQVLGVVRSCFGGKNKNKENKTGIGRGTNIL